MIEPCDCTVRYWLGPTEAKTRQSDNEYYRAFEKVLESHKDLMPLYTIDSEFDDLWLYCLQPVSYLMKCIVESHTCGIFNLWHEFEL